MGGFGDEVMTRAAIAFPMGAETIDDALAYRRWIVHTCDLGAAVALWAADMPYTTAEQNAVPVELAKAFHRMRSMSPLEYWAHDFRRWEDFVMWCRTHPQYDEAGMPITYTPDPAQP